LTLPRPAKTHIRLIQYNITGHSAQSISGRLYNTITCSLFIYSAIIRTAIYPLAVPMLVIIGRSIFLYPLSFMDLFVSFRNYKSENRLTKAKLKNKNMAKASNQNDGTIFTETAPAKIRKV